jgi:hypothetical protein
MSVFREQPMTDSLTVHLLLALGLGELLGLLPSLSHLRYLPWLAIAALLLGQIFLPRLAAVMAKRRALSAHPPSR